MQIRSAIAVLCLFLLASCGGGGSDEGVAIADVPLSDAQKYVLSGDWDVGAENTRAFVVRSADEWNQVWEARKVHVTCPDVYGWNTSFCASSAPPPIDFERYTLVGILLHGYFIFQEPNPRRVEDDGQILSVSYRYHGSGHAGFYPTSTRFFLVPRTISALRVNAKQCNDPC